MNSRHKIVAIIRTKGQAPYLEQVISRARNAGLSVFLLDNNPEPMWFDLYKKNVDYLHDPQPYIPMCTEMFKEVCSGKDNDSCIATMYNKAFDQSRYPGCWLLKLDDDDLWMPKSFERLKVAIASTEKTSIIYFSGVNLLNKQNISAGVTFCGGRDHFCIGPNVSPKFINGEQWELAVFKGVSHTKFLGLTYAHLKFFGESTGYAKDIQDSSQKYLNSLEERIRKPIPIEYLRSFRVRFLGLFFQCFPKLAKNSQLGMIHANKFYDEISDSFFK